MAPTDDEQSDKYVYYTASNMTGARRTSTLDDVVGGRVYDSQTMSRVRQLTVTQSVSVDLYCIAAGGYPAPRLRMFVGNRDVTERFRWQSTSTLRGVVGMRVIDIRSELHSVEWRIDAADDDTTVRCTAFVDNHLGEQFAAISLHVRRMSCTICTLYTSSSSSS